ncbi:MAG: hypothetical protein LBU88_08335 [Treponema sp.]|jgi:glycosyltransferase involved in cell wall biosynthesis|nr:hypothetical protein [Treponema sp.]
MKTVLIVTYMPLHKEPRVIRQIQALSNDYQIFTIGSTPSNYNNITHYSTISSFKKKYNKHIVFKIFRKLNKYLNRLKILLNINILNILFNDLGLEYMLSQNIIKPDIIIAHDLNGLYLSSELKKKHKWECKIHFDAHEYFPNQLSSSFKWKLFIRPIVLWVLKKCKNDISIMSTVCDGIAREYEKFFKYPAGSVRVITNAADYNNISKPLNLAEDKIRLIHHGGAIKERKLDLMIKMMKYLDPEKYELTFMLVKSNPKYYDYLVKLSKKYINIKFIEPVPFSEIINTLNSYDIGVYLILPEHYNHKHCLPNKLFEFIQARLAIAIGPSIEMKKMVEQYNLGIASERFTPKSLASSIKQMTPEKIMEYKMNADKYAKKLSGEENMVKIRDIVAELTRV